MNDPLIGSEVMLTENIAKLLYIMSFFFDLTSYNPVYDYGSPYQPITAVTHLDAAMAQVTVR